METENLLDYETLNEETKTLLNKAMDIYFTIKDKNIEKLVKGIIGKTNYTFTRLDKKIFSIYLAGFLTDTSLRTILEEFDEIKTEDLFDFIDITEEDIKSLDNSDYKEYYDTKFKLTLETMKEDLPQNYEKIIPEVIFYWLGFSYSTRSRIIDYFMKANIPNAPSFAEDHPSFKMIKKAAKQTGAMKEKSNREYNLNRTSPFLGVPKEETALETQAQKFDINDENLWSLLEDIKKKFIGQETAAENLFYNIVNNQDLAFQKDIDDGQRSIIFMDGPTGTGKTAITREITEQLDIPFISTSVTKYSATGYVGGDLTDILKDLVKKANGDVEKAQRGIVVLDEFDKLAYDNNRAQVMKQDVQQQLLDFMGGGKYTLTTSMGLFGSTSTEFDTSKLTFICLGALTNLRENKQEIKPAIGFGEQIQKQEEKEYAITPQDLIDLGLERELVGRFNTYLHTEEYSKDTLLRILKESTISPIHGFEKWVSSKNKQLIIEEEVYETIAQAAYELNTGARSLQTIMNSIRTPFLKEVIRGENPIVELNTSVVKEIVDNTSHRKGRM